MTGAAWVRLITTGVVSKVPCLLRGVVVTPNGESNKGLVTLYNGEGTGDPVLYPVRCGAGESKQLIFEPGLICDRGLYIVLGSHVDECLVHFELPARGAGQSNEAVE